MIDVSNWPSYCRIREFELKPNPTTGGDSSSDSKNVTVEPNVIQQSPNQSAMDTRQSEVLIEVPQVTL